MERNSKKLASRGAVTNKVICNETGWVFDSQRILARWLEVSAVHVWRHLNGLAPRIHPKYTFRRLEENDERTMGRR